MPRISAITISLVFSVFAAVASAPAQSNQLPAPVPSPSPTPWTLPSPTPYTAPTPVPFALPSTTPWSLPTPAPGSASSPAPAPSPPPAPTPLPDGTMPLTPPPMPAPAIPDASTLSDQLNLPLPAPGQMSEPLAPGSETNTLKDSEQLAMQQKMVMADFEKSLTKLIAQQRNPKVADMTLNDAVRIALKENPTILNAIQQIRLTRGQLISVVSQAIPKISLATSYNQTQQDLTTNGARPTSGTIEIPNPNGGKPTVLQIGSSSQAVQNQTWNIAFQGTQLIYDGGATIADIQGGRAGYDAAFFSLRSTIDNIVSQIITQFYQIVLNRALIVAQQQHVTLLQHQVQDQQNRYEAGTVPRFNVLQAEVQLANAKPPLIQAQNDYRIALYQLVQLLGMDYPRGSPGEVPFNIVGTLGYSLRKVKADESIRVAIARNPSLKAQRQAILVEAYNVTSQIAGWFPTINANAGYEMANNTASQNLSDNAIGWFFGATGNWNIWDGGLTYGNVSQAKAKLMQAKNNYDNGIRQVVLDVQVAISNLQQAQETIDATTASVVQATEALRLSQERLDAGAGTQLDVLNAQTQLLTAQSNVLQARYDYIAAMASYDFALSLDTQYVETFDDPLVRPLNPQALNSGERQRFQKTTDPAKPQAKLPRAFKDEDPVKPILEEAPKSKKKTAPNRNK